MNPSTAPPVYSILKAIWSHSGASPRPRQAWAGSPGFRISASAQSQAWAKPLGGGRHALFILSNASAPIDVRVPLGAVSPQLNASGATVHARDLYTAADLGVVSGAFTAEALGAHDSRFIRLALA